MTVKQEVQSVTDDRVWWSVDKAALHLGCPKKTILRYIREGLPIRAGLIHRDELLADFRARKMRQIESRMTRKNK
jgi:hypothetical protein